MGDKRRYFIAQRLNGPKSCSSQRQSDEVRGGRGGGGGRGEGKINESYHTYKSVMSHQQQHSRHRATRRFFRPTSLFFRVLPCHMESLCQKKAGKNAKEKGGGTKEPASQKRVWGWGSCRGVASGICVCLCVWGGASQRQCILILEK